MTLAVSGTAKKTFLLDRLLASDENHALGARVRAIVNDRDGVYSFEKLAV